MANRVWTAMHVAAGLLIAVAATADAFSGLGLNGLATLQDGRTMRASSCAEKDWPTNNADARPIEPGQTLVLADLKGPGEIRHIWNTIAMDREGPLYSKMLVLRMYWDGETNPSVECPIGDFFGIGHGAWVPYDSLPIRVTSDGRGRNCYWPMPFAKSAKITVTNEARQRCDAFYYYIDWQKLPKLSKKTGYFHAVYRQEYPATMGKNYLIADLQGRGQYVGTVLNWRSRMPSWPGEGDDFFYIDGEQEPSLRGTGTEDYFCDGWGFRKQAGIFYGAPLSEWGETNGKTSVYRWHIADPVTFAKSLRVEIEHKGPVFDEYGKMTSHYDERPDDYSSVAFWYQKEPHKPFDPMPAGYARQYFDPQQAIEGESLIAEASATAGAIVKQDLPMMSGGAQLLWAPEAPGQSVSVSVAVVEKGSYDLFVRLGQAPDYGAWQIEVDGKAVGGIVDLYQANASIREVCLANLHLEAGAHSVTFVNKDKNKESKGFLLGLDAMVFAAR